MFNILKYIGVLVSLLLIATVSSVSAYNYSGYRWASNKVPVNFDTDIAGWPMHLINEPRGVWEGATNGKFMFRWTGHKLYGVNDGRNTITRFPLNGTLANLAAVTSIRPAMHNFTEMDTIFNMRHAWSFTGEPGKVDVKNVLTHEFGHWLILLDVTGSGNKEKTMYESVQAGETKKRSLDNDDIAGIRSIYK